MPKVYIIHGWHSTSKTDWIPWLKERLELEGFEAIAPDMPNTDTPKIDEWVPFLGHLAGVADGDVYFVGHSIGCQTILRYLQDLPSAAKVKGVILVAPWVHKLTNLPEGEPEIAKPWLETPIDWARVRKHPSDIIAIYSDNDPYVPVSEAKILEKRLSAKLVLVPGKGHFSEDDEVTQLPILLEQLKSLI